MSGTLGLVRGSARGVLGERVGSGVKLYENASSKPEAMARGDHGYENC